MDRRGFIAAGAAALATPTWAAIGHPRLLTAASDSAGRTFLAGLSRQGEVLFLIPLPGRGHAAIAHPLRAEAVAFARRPGNFAVVLDCAKGRDIHKLTAPEGRHFYGHGAYSLDGKWLFTTENDFNLPDGRIGVWDTQRGYIRVGEFASGGIGPHEILCLKVDILVVANGGIQTHPDFGRAKLNLPDMQSNLTFLSPAGEVLHKVASPPEMHQNSIRHLAADNSGRIFIALQWQGDPRRTVPLTAVCDGVGAGLRLMPHPQDARLKHYAGSIAIQPSNGEVLVTGPKGDFVLRFDNNGDPQTGVPLPMPSGAAPLCDSVAITAQGGIRLLRGKTSRTLSTNMQLTWDNHLVPV